MTAILEAFQVFREDLDEHADRRERIIHSSRDITNISKKTIFLLHRLALEAQDASEDHDARINASKAGSKQLSQVTEMYESLKDELAGERFWRYQRQVSPGLQEYIEALSFAHFLEHGNLITYPEVQTTLCGSDGKEYFPLTISDYLLGISDLTGELMRFAISGFSRSGGRAKALETCAFVRSCKSDFERFTSYIWELNKKQAVTAQSLKKIEDAAYTAVVRSSEYDIPPEMLDDIVNEFVSNYSNKNSYEHVQHPRRGRGNEDDGFNSFS